MRRITKGPEPQSLTQHRVDLFKEYQAELPDRAWPDYRDKATAREYLHKEQNGFCCFCMRPIEATEHGMRIAHFLPQHPMPIDPGPPRGHTLDWKNLFGSCSSHEGEEHCDVRQRNHRLHERLNPCTYQRGTLKYEVSGKVTADDKGIESDINNKLGLNVEFLRQERRDALNVFQAFRFPPRIKPSAKLLRNLIEKLERCPEAYGEVILQFLSKRLKRLTDSNC